MVSRASLVLAGMLSVACAPVERLPKDAGNCFVVRYDAAGRRVVVRGARLTRISDLHVVLRDVRAMDGQSGFKAAEMDIASNSIVIEEGHCYVDF